MQLHLRSLRGLVNIMWKNLAVFSAVFSSRIHTKSEKHGWNKKLIWPKKDSLLCEDVWHMVWPSKWEVNGLVSNRDETGKKMSKFRVPKILKEIAVSLSLPWQFRKIIFLNQENYFYCPAIFCGQNLWGRLRLISTLVSITPPSNPHVHWLKLCSV